MLQKAIKDAQLTDEGQVTCIFSTLNVKDLDGDVTLPGAFKEGQEVRISAYNHMSWGDKLPVGKGVIHTEGEKAIMTGQFFMDTTMGKDTFITVKELGTLGEWSYGYNILDSAMGMYEGEQVQFLKSLDVVEVSPVLLGAGIGTQTIEAKSAAMKSAIAYAKSEVKDDSWDGPGEQASIPNTADAKFLRQFYAWVDPDGNPDAKASYKFIHHHYVDDTEAGPANVRACVGSIGVLNGARGGSNIPDGDKRAVYHHVAQHLSDAGVTPPPLKSSGASFVDEAFVVLAEASALYHRSGSLADLRGKDGRTLSPANQGRLAAVAEELKAVTEALDQLLLESRPEDNRAEIERQYARYVQITQAI